MGREGGEGGEGGEGVHHENRKQKTDMRLQERMEDRVGGQGSGWREGRLPERERERVRERERLEESEAKNIVLFTFQEYSRVGLSSVAQKTAAVSSVR